MSAFDFYRDEAAEGFCREIVAQMTVDFGIPEEEAVARVNQFWRGLRIEGDDLIYHESAVYWAWHMYYGGDSLWWMQGDERERHNLPPLLPRPL